MTRALVVAWALLAVTAARGQLATDGTMGAMQSFSGDNVTLPQSLGSTSGANLFHSFSSFNVAAGQTVTFEGSGVDRIVSRVTGGSQSEIHGALRSTAAGADLYLINPAGILFGDDASVDVDGAFVAATANRVDFADGRSLAVSASAPGALSVAHPTTFGFLATNPGTLQMRAATVETNGSVGLAAGTVDLFGSTITTTEGSISMAGTSGADLMIAPESMRFAGDLTGNVRVGGGSALESFGFNTGIFITGRDLFVIDSELTAGAVESDALVQGVVIELGGELLVSGGTIQAQDLLGAPPGGGGPPAGGGGGPPGGGPPGGGGGGANAPGQAGARYGLAGVLTISADSVLLQEDATLFGAQALQVDARSMSIFDSTVRLQSSGDPTPQPLSLDIEEALHLDGGVIGVTADAGIQVPRLDIRAGTMLLDGESEVGVVSRALGAIPNDIALNLGELRILGGTMSFRMFQEAGPDAVRPQAVINADLVDISPTVAAIGGILSPNFGETPGIDLILNVGVLRLTNGGRISVSTIDQGAAGSLTINATELVELRGDRSGLFAGSGTDAPPDFEFPDVLGDAGRIEIVAPQVVVAQRAEVISSTVGLGNAESIRIEADSVLIDRATVAVSSLGEGPSGDAGSVEIVAREIETRGLFLVSSVSMGSGQSGSILLQGERVTLGGNGALSSAARGRRGEAGSVEVRSLGNLDVLGPRLAVQAQEGDAGSLTLISGGDIRIVGAELAARSFGNSGDIKLDAPGIILIKDSVVSALAQGDGGRIDIDPVAVILDNSIINGLAGGDPVFVTITTDVFIQSPDSEILTNTPIDLPETDLTSGLTPFSANPLRAGDELSARCTAQVPGGVSSFIMSAKGGSVRDADQLQPILILPKADVEDGP